MSNKCMEFPGNLRRALTLSYDDGVEQDIRLIDIMNRHGLKGTFNLNSGLYAAEGTVYPQGHVHRRLSRSQVTEVYGRSGQEVAIHCYTHADLAQQSPENVAWEVMKDKETLEEQFGRIIRGMAYPFGTTNDAVAETLRRCGVAYACVGVDLMPTEERESISKVKPTGWVQNQYDFVDGGSLYNRCHLIGFQLTGENANEKNLITGTRYMNVEGMLPFENQVADYVASTGNHVLYRVTPAFVDTELVARGVEMEAYSVEDQGRGVCFHVYCYNVQPGVEIDYATGENWEA